MSGPEPSIQNAAALIYKAVNVGLATSADAAYRELTALYLADPGFRQTCELIAGGLQLMILDAVETRGMVVVPASRESAFAVRMSDIRQTAMDQSQKAALVLAHIAICAVYFPTSDGLDDDTLDPAPATLATCRDTLYSLASRLKQANDDQELTPDIPPTLQPGWEAVCALPLTLRDAVRAGTNSVSGIVKIALNQMKDGGLVRLDRDNEDDQQAAYTATRRLRVQLREIGLKRLFEMSQACATYRR